MPERRSRQHAAVFPRSLLGLTAALCLVFFLSPAMPAETVHQVFFEGTDHQLDVYHVKGQTPGPTLMLMGGIQGDEPGGYLAADVYADISLKKGNLIVVPRANFLSILLNERAPAGDMNRKFALTGNPVDRDAAIVGIIKTFMRKSDFFLNLHDGSGFYSPVWEAPNRNPSRFGQSVIADAADYTRPDGTGFNMETLVRKVLEKVNPQISAPEHRFRFNNHRTMASDTQHKEQRLSATFHALTQVGIPAFGIETSKDIGDFGLRVRYQTLVVNAFLEECGIEMENPKICLEAPFLKFLIASINGQTPIVLHANDVLRVRQGDTLRMTHIEANYSRGLTVRLKGWSPRLNDLNHDVALTKGSTIEVRKDRFLMAGIPVEITQQAPSSPRKGRLEPRVRYFCAKVNGKAQALEPGETLTILRGDVLTILDPRTNLDSREEQGMKIDLRGFQAKSSDSLDDRGHAIDTANDLQKQYATISGDTLVFPLQAKLNKRVFAESSIAVAEPKLEYMVLGRSGDFPFVAYAGDRLELPGGCILTIMDVKTNSAEESPLSITMAGRTVTWQKSGSAGIDSSKLDASEMPLDITRNGCSIGRIWLKQGPELRVTSGDRSARPPVLKVRYEGTVQK